MSVTPADQREGIAGYHVESGHGDDIRRDLSRTVVTNGWGLLELRPQQMSLEDIFLQLTTEDAPADTLAADAGTGDEANTEDRTDG